jgi:FeS assembly SUF system regulator
VIRISRMADYAVLASTYMAQHAADVHTAASVAESTGVPVPSASKLLKQLAKADLLTSRRGAKGGYSLARSPADISVAELIAAVDGPIAIADCLGEERHCDLENICVVRAPWQRVSDAIEGALADVSLADMLTSMTVEGPFGVPEAASAQVAP